MNIKQSLLPLRLHCDKEYNFFIQYLPSVFLGDKKELPEIPAVYFVISNKNLIYYIGQAQNLKKRFVSHHLYKYFSVLEKPMIHWISVSDETKREFLEKDYINWFDPILNERNPFFEELFLGKRVFLELIRQVEAKSLFNMDIFALKRFSKEQILLPLRYDENQGVCRFILIAFSINQKDLSEEIIFISNACDSHNLIEQKKSLEEYLGSRNASFLNYSFISFVKKNGFHRDSSYYLSKHFVNKFHPKFNVKNLGIRGFQFLNSTESNQNNKFDYSLMQERYNRKFISVYIPIEYELGSIEKKFFFGSAEWIPSKKIEKINKSFIANSLIND